VRVLARTLIATALACPCSRLGPTALVWRAQQRLTWTVLPWMKGRCVALCHLSSRHPLHVPRTHVEPTVLGPLLCVCRRVLDSLVTRYVVGEVCVCGLLLLVPVCVVCRYTLPLLPKQGLLRVQGQAQVVRVGRWCACVRTLRLATASA
jgi:hypothetical protein